MRCSCTRLKCSHLKPAARHLIVQHQLSLSLLQLDVEHVAAWYITSGDMHPAETSSSCAACRLVEALEDMDGAGMDEYSDMSTADTALLQDPKGHHRRVSSSSSGGPPL